MESDSIKSDTRMFALGAGVVVALVVAAVFVVPRLLGFANPFSSETVDRTPPVVLTEINDLAEFKAAEAQFEVLIDEENDIRFVPGFIAGDRVQYVAVGAIEATVDFAGLTEDSIEFDEETGRAVITLPAPTLGDPVIDFENSGVMNRDRGVLDRAGGFFTDSPTGEESLIVAASDKMVEAVPASDLLERAEENTEKMLTTLLGGVGVEEVDVIFEEPSGL